MCRSVMAVVLVFAFAESSLAQAGAGDSPHPGRAPDNLRMTKRETEKLRRRVDYIPAANLVSALPGNASVAGRTVQTSGDEQTNFQLIRRRESGQPEVHARWDDFLIVRSGEGVLVIGDSLRGSTYRAPGERRGGQLSKSYNLPLRVGDVIRIPAAVPHIVTVPKGGTLEYLLIKQRRQELPVRWFSAR
jgi:mannose-6-phosphate isomerase-like protein (cupin superfamily)